MIFATLFVGAVLPFLVTAVVLGAVDGFDRNRAREGGCRGFVLAGALAYPLAHGLVRGGLPFPPVESVDWLPFFALLAGVVGLLEAGLPRLGRGRWLLRLVVVAGLLWTTLSPLVRYAWSALAAAGWMAALEIAVLLFWGAVESHVRRDEPLAAPLSFLLLSVGSSGILLLSNSAVLGQLAGVLAAVLGAWLLMAVLRPRRFPARGSGAVLTLVLAGLWMQGYFYADLPLSSLVLLALVPATAVVGEALRRRGRSRLVALAGEWALASLLVGLAAVGPLLASWRAVADPYAMG
ncbi:MAG: hypothetical protein Q9Q40_08040 [Acidobacteriota bacterium]|nr:hypothetical protein [Acidobacteriota bacterium]MDQ7086659.1 hypothetical protein [Acidobacteriota bacterium]